MEFPSRLSLELAKARFPAFLRGASGRSILRVDPAEILHARDAQPVSIGKIEEILGSRRRIVWVGGGEPLAHSGVAHLVRSIAARGRFVFLETDGILLRRRIHEFQPLPNVAFVIRVDSCPAAGFVSGLVPERLQLAVEGIRAAHLSGFFTAIHSRVCGAPPEPAWSRLAEFVKDLPVDGWLLTAANPGTVGRARELRPLIPNSRWRAFSASLERELLLARESTSRDASRAPMQQDAAPEPREESVAAS